MSNEAIYVEGIGYIGQYNSYLDTFWSKGIAYYLIDQFNKDLESLLEQNASSNEIRQLVKRINDLNRVIADFEKDKLKFLTKEEQDKHGLFKG